MQSRRVNEWLPPIIVLLQMLEADPLMVRSTDKIAYVLLECRDHVALTRYEHM